MCISLFSFYFFCLMIRRPPRSTLFPTRRSSDLRGSDAPGLLRGFVHDLTPALQARSRSFDEVMPAALCDHRRDPAHTQLGEFFKSPFHTVKFEDGEINCDLRQMCARDLRSKMEFHAVFGGKLHRPQAQHSAGDDFKLLSRFDAKNAEQVRGIVIEKKGTITCNAIGDPAAA